MARCRAGEVDAFDTLYRLHGPRIYTLARRLSGAQEAEDLLQEIFLQAHRKLASFKGNSTIGTWLYRLALNHCLDFVRSRRARMDRLTASLEDDCGSFEAVAPPETPVARLDLERAIERLPAGCREIFVLHEIEGLDHREIAVTLGIAEGTSKSQVFKARLKLRAMLSERT